jgi:hypothetical protein
MDRYQADCADSAFDPAPTEDSGKWLYGNTTLDAKKGGKRVYRWRAPSTLRRITNVWCNQHETK